MARDWAEPVRLGNGGVGPAGALRGRLLRRFLGRARIRSLFDDPLPATGLRRADDPRSHPPRCHPGGLRQAKAGQAHAVLRGDHLHPLHVHLPIRGVHCDRQGDGAPLGDGPPSPDDNGGVRNSRLHGVWGPSCFIGH